MRHRFEFIAIIAHEGDKQVEYLPITLSRTGRVQWVGDEYQGEGLAINDFCKAGGWTIMTAQFAPYTDSRGGDWECLLQRPVEALTPMQKFLDRYPVYVTDNPSEVDR